MMPHGCPKFASLFFLCLTPLPALAATPVSRSAAQVDRPTGSRREAPAASKTASTDSPSKKREVQEDRPPDAPHAPGYPPLTTAEDRDRRESWMVHTAGELRMRREEGRVDAPTRAETRRLAEELERNGVDWRTFMCTVTNNADVPEMPIADHTVYRLADALNVRRDLQVATGRRPEACDVLPDGSVRDSAFFTNVEIASYTPERIAQETRDARPKGKITVTRAKKVGSSWGFRGKDSKGTDYIFIMDPPFNPEMNSTADYIGATLARILGFRAPKLAMTTVEGTDRPYYNGVRAVATLEVKGTRGGWQYRTFRNRRVPRGSLIVAAWLNDYDRTDQNTGTSTGHGGATVYYQWDWSSSLGSFDFRPKWPGTQYTYIFSLGGELRQLLAKRGLLPVPWETDFRQYSAAVGYFPVKFDPDAWKPWYPNYAFLDATEADKRWAARLIGQVTDEQIRAVVELGRYTYRSDAEYVIATLIARRNCITRRYLGVDGPLRVEHRWIDAPPPKGNSTAPVEKAPRAAAAAPNREASRRPEP